MVTRRRFKLVYFIIFLAMFNVVPLYFNGPVLSDQNFDIFDTKFPPRKLMSFLDVARNLSWENLIRSIRNQKSNPASFRESAEDVFTQLLPFVIKSPEIPVNSTRHPPPFNTTDQRHPCKSLGHPRKLALAFCLGFDADTLEILMNELDPLVDKYFILESTTTYHLSVPKPLVWERLRLQPRFQMFRKKVIYIISHDSESISNLTNPYNLQTNQEHHLWEKIKHWNKLNGNYFDSKDIISFSDLDEVPNRNTMFYLKNCELPSDPVDIGLWFPFGNVTTAFSTDYPVSGGSLPGRYFTFAAPTVWTFGSVQKALDQSEGSFSFRKRGATTKYLLGGMHMSEYNYAPFKISKMLTSIEMFNEDSADFNAEKLRYIADILVGNYTALEDVSGLRAEDKLKLLGNILERNPTLEGRVYKLTDICHVYPWICRDLVKIPWFLNCNVERYPSWFGEIDMRLK